MKVKTAKCSSWKINHPGQFCLKLKVCGWEIDLHRGSCVWKGKTSGRAPPKRRSKDKVVGARSNIVSTREADSFLTVGFEQQQPLTTSSGPVSIQQRYGLVSKSARRRGLSKAKHSDWLQVKPRQWHDAYIQLTLSISLSLVGRRVRCWEGVD